MPLDIKSLMMQNAPVRAPMLNGMQAATSPPSYITTLSPDQEAKYNAWRKKLPGELSNDSDYDLRGLFKNNPNQAPSSNLHFPDTYKRPNHITFSDQSIYHNPKGGVVGGHWGVENGKDFFQASPLNVKNAGGEEGLKRYFQKYEPTITLKLPK